MMNILITLLTPFILSIAVNADTKIALDQKLSFLSRNSIEVIKSSSSGDSTKIYHVEFILDKLFYNIEVITPILKENALSITNNSYFILLKSFEATPTPYVGQITKVQDCNSISKPSINMIQLKDFQIKLISYSTNSTLRPGVCVKEKSTIEVCQAYFFIPQLNSFVKVKSNSFAGAKCLRSTRKFLKELNI